MKGRTEGVFKLQVKVQKTEYQAFLLVLTTDLEYSCNSSKFFFNF